MSAQEINLTAMSHDAAVEIADSFEAAFECVPVILAGREKPSMAEAVMVCGYALLHQLKMQHWEIRDTLNDLRESIDFQAAQPGSDDLPTDHERLVIYRALEANYFAHTVPENIQAMEKDLARFKRLAGLVV